jgi:hypothetical protein
MGRPTGRPPKPLEEKLRLGNPGKRALPDRANLVPLPAAAEPPEPHRPLGPAGRDLWNRAWNSAAGWLAQHIDSEQVLITCEQIDERQALRISVLREGNWRDRAALRALDAQIMDGLAVLGFNPVERGRLGVAEVKRASKLDELIARRQARG